MEILPQPSIKLPPTKEGMRFTMSRLRMKWLSDVVELQSGAIGIECELRQDKSNLDAILDHWPNGSPRDHLVMYEDSEPIPRDYNIPGNIHRGIE